MNDGRGEIERRKTSHLDICRDRDVEARRSTLLDEVHLLHEALPEISLSEVDLSTELFGRLLLAPLLISGMTGGTARAGALNRDLAETAQKLGLGMGLGSQRAMLLDPEVVDSYCVRHVAPDIPLLANLGAVQARIAGPDAVASLVEKIGADAVCIHLNPAQELVQDEGDRDFRGCLDGIAELVRQLPVSIVVKETGCGLSPSTLARLRDAGVRWVDVSGAGGTTWAGVESHRGSERQQRLGEALHEWGIPTAPAVAFARHRGLETIASGGIRNGLDAARALALGARVVAMALPFLRAHADRGQTGVLKTAEQIVEALRAVCVLTGARSLAELHEVPRVLGPNLRSWLEIDGLGSPSC